MDEAGCSVCDHVVVAMDPELADRLGPIRGDHTLHRLIDEVAAGRLTHLRGDCALTDTEALVEAETKYTVVHFFRCNSCADTIFFGLCIRGWPIYKKVPPSDVDRWWDAPPVSTRSPV